MGTAGTGVSAVGSCVCWRIKLQTVAKVGAVKYYEAE